MSRIAVDVVLLPDRDMTERAIRINREIVRRYGSEIVLDKETCLPHISLAMGCINEPGIDLIRKLLERLAGKVHVRQLNATGILISTNSRGEDTSVLEIERTSELQSLHGAVMREVEPLFSHDVNDVMLADEAATGSTLQWIRDYRQKAAFERFSPHVTLGYGTATTDEPFPIRFTASHLALCHLGNHCTCRRILVSVSA